MEFIKAVLRKFYYLINDGKITSLKVYKHLANSKWIIDSRFGMAYFKGYYEPKICDYLLKNIKNDSVFVDVGSHAGYFSLFAATLATKGKVYSFEPEPGNYNYINKIKDLNGINNWDVINSGVGNEKGTLFFSTGPSSTTGKIADAGDFKVEVITLDDVLINTTSVDVIKIDVEGFGGKVLQGAVKIIDKHLPKIMFEVHKNSDELEVLKQILGNRYLLKDLDTGKIISDDKEPHFIISEPTSN